jgi:hypothetical protein
MIKKLKDKNNSNDLITKKIKNFKNNISALEKLGNIKIVNKQKIKALIKKAFTCFFLVRNITILIIYRHNLCNVKNIE